jgi:lysophospholipase
MAEPRVPRGVCVVFNGQGEYVEKYREVLQELGERGFTVATFDWRGQGGSDRLLADPYVGHVGDFADYDEDVRAFFATVVDPLTTGPVTALGHSMGGHMLIRTLHAMPERFSAAVLSAPMLKIRTRGLFKPLADAAIALNNAVGRKRDYAWGMTRRDPALVPFEAQVLTSDAARYARTQDFLKRHPEMRIFGPSWGWLGAAYRSIAEVQAPGYAEKIATPVMVVGAGNDRVCHTDAARDYVRRLPNGRFVEIAGARHEILREQDLIRQTFWLAFDTFVKNGART